MQLETFIKYWKITTRRLIKWGRVFEEAHGSCIDARLARCLCIDAQRRSTQLERWPEERCRSLKWRRPGWVTVYCERTTSTEASILESNCSATEPMTHRSSAWRCELPNTTRSAPHSRAPLARASTIPVTPYMASVYKIRVSRVTPSPMVDLACVNSLRLALGSVSSVAT